MKQSYAEVKLKKSKSIPVFLSHEQCLRLSHTNNFGDVNSEDSASFHGCTIGGNSKYRFLRNKANFLHEGNNLIHPNLKFLEI